MELNRRDAILALGGLGLTATAWLTEASLDDTDLALSAGDVDTLVALAEPLYPSAVDATPEFVESYVIGQHELDPDHPAGIKRSLRTVRREARRRTGSEPAALSPDRRDEILRATGADRAHPHPDGTDAEQVRYYVVNNLLYALYATPKGGGLVGNPNPPGFPGGIAAYREAPTDE